MNKEELEMWWDIFDRASALAVAGRSPTKETMANAHLLACLRDAVDEIIKERHP